MKQSWTNKRGQYSVLKKDVTGCFDQAPRSPRIVHDLLDRIVLNKLAFTYLKVQQLKGKGQLAVLEVMKGNREGNRNRYVL